MHEEGLDSLREFFFTVKALQKGVPNGTVRSEALQRLDKLYHSPAFGTGPERPTVYHPEPPMGWEFREHEPRFLSGVVDGIYLAMRENGWNSRDHNTQAIVREAVELQRTGKLGVNLVALATLVDDKEHQYDGQIDPVCLTYSLFTTVLSRAEARGGGAPVKFTYQWNVDSEVEELGAAVVNAYNQAFAQALPKERIQATPFHKADAERCSYAANASDLRLGRERIVRVDSHDIEGILHWAVRWNGKRYVTLTFTSPEIVDPVAYKKDPRIIDAYSPKPTIG